MVVFAGQGDARRSMSLLWRAERPEQARRGSAPGPRPGLSVDAIVTAAIAVADEEGMAALSMRAVGERLGRTAMALYTYVPGKGELLDLMYDAVHVELPGSGAYADTADWRAGLTSWARDTLAFQLRHPWVLQVSQARPVLGPHEYAALDTLVHLLNGTGLGAPLVRRLVGALTHLVRGCAGTVAEARQAAAVTGEPDEGWWFARSALLGEVAPDFADRYPALVAMEHGSAPQPPSAADTGSGEGGAGSGEGHAGDGGGDAGAMPYLEREARETFAVGLDVLLDGIEAAIRRTEAP
ncbi:TetR/AcrR family transcriptional regulator C-terminal domain-containing protein [Streptomyces sp. NPDC056061]|uniref:TetR/AcrR family transcriptional regulator C-terminal domain-containing protein n=1 Tax=Streptomyces sp. NPDC056061 TaxID=3345700 RepID=UPI0035D86539